MIPFIAAVGCVVFIVAAPALIVGRSTEMLVRWVEARKTERPPR